MCSLDVRLRILRSIPFFKSLSDQDVEAVNRYFKEMGFSPGEYLYLSGDLGRRLFVLAEGRVRLLRLTASGKQVMLDLIIPGEFFGSLSQDGQPYPDSAQAQTPVCALAISADDFRSLLAAYPPVALDVLDSLSARLQEAHNSIHLLSAEPAEKRIAYILLKLGKKLGRPGSEGLLIETPLGRDELADMTGITTETASRVISQFQKEGWIATGRQWVAIKDEAALNDILS